MNPVLEGENRSLAYKDAIFFSPHKFLGGDYFINQIGPGKNNFKYK
jgi:hypothetical protein